MSRVEEVAVGSAIETELDLVPATASNERIKECGEERMLKGAVWTVGEQLGLLWCSV